MRWEDLPRVAFVPPTASKEDAEDIIENLRRAVDEIEEAERRVPINDPDGVRSLRNAKRHVRDASERFEKALEKQTG